MDCMGNARWVLMRFAKSSKAPPSMDDDYVVACAFRNGVILTSETADSAFGGTLVYPNSWVYHHGESICFPLNWG